MHIVESVCRHNLERAKFTQAWIEGIPVGNGTPCFIWRVKQLCCAVGAAPELHGEFRGLRSSSGELLSGVIENGKLVTAELNCERSGTRRFAVDSEPSDWQCSLPAFRREEHAGHTIMTAEVTKGGTCRLYRR